MSNLSSKSAQTGIIIDRNANLFCIIKNIQLIPMLKSYLTIVFTIIFLSSMLRVNSQVQPASAMVQKTNPTTAQIISIQEDPQNQIGLIYTVRKLDEGRKLIEEGNYIEAEKILLDAKDWLTSATEYHYNLFQLYNRQQKNALLAKIEKAHAADFGHARDQSFFLLAKAFIGENKLREAVELLVEIIKSQNGTILSEQAYKTLQDIRFSDKPRN